MCTSFHNIEATSSLLQIVPIMSNTKASGGSPPSIAIMNGSSRTGAAYAALALAEGSHVHLIVRSASRVSKDLTTPKPSPNLHIHELANIFDPAALAPILAEVDFLVLAFVVAPERARDMTTLNHDAAVATVAGIRAGQPAGQPPRTKVVLLSAITEHPKSQGTFMVGLLHRLIPHQYADLERTAEYLRAQGAWGLEWAAMAPGGIVQAQPAESEEVRRRGVRLVDDPNTEGAQRISYGRLGGAFVMLTEDWDRWKNGYVLPACVNARWISGRSDAWAVVWCNIKAAARQSAVWVALVAAGWQVGLRYGDLGSKGFVNGLMNWKS